MRKWMAVAAVLTGAVWVTIACQREAPQAPTAVAGGDGSGTVAVMASPSPVVIPSNMPVPTQPQPFPIGPNPGPQPSASPSGQPGPGPGPGPTPTPTATPTPSPSATPPPNAFTVSDLVVSTGNTYQLVGFNNGFCCDRSSGAAFTDLGFHYEINISAPDRVYMIRTAQADTFSMNNPVMSFTIDKCALVSIYMPEAGPAPCYPSWITSAGGWECSRPVNTDGTCAGTAFGFVTMRSLNDPTQTLRATYCHKVFRANDRVQLGPRMPSGPPQYMYGVTVRPQGCPPTFAPSWDDGEE